MIAWIGKAKGSRKTPSQRPQSLLILMSHDAICMDCERYKNAQTLLRSASEFLHKATYGRVYFKHATIEVPMTWPKRRSARALSSSAFYRSDVPEEQHGDKPFTEQVHLCGQPGNFIHLTPRFLATLDKSAAYVFVHEWAHFRYGVFDEYGSLNDSRHPFTYCRKEKKLPRERASNRLPSSRSPCSRSSTAPPKTPPPIEWTISRGWRPEGASRSRKILWKRTCLREKSGTWPCRMCARESTSRSWWSSRGRGQELILLLEWHNEDSGQEIGVSKHDAGLEVDFGNQTVITEADVVEGNLDPLSSSDRHITTLSLPRTFSSLGQDGSLNWHTDLTAQVANSEGLKFERGASVLRTSACDDSSRYHHESLNDHKGHKGRHNGSYRDDANC
ncbi:uncharacterized protein LOC144108090 [Amblyomma americanum]